MLLFELTKNKYQVINGKSIKLGDKTFVQNSADVRSGERLVLIDTTLLDDLWKHDRSSYIDSNYQNHIGNRIENFKKFYAENDTIEVGTVFINRDRYAAFGDGRHRTRVLIEYGYDMIPVSMSDESIKNLSRIVQ